jgi:hypothetical protein
MKKRRRKLWLLGEAAGLIGFIVGTMVAAPISSPTTADILWRLDS